MSTSSTSANTADDNQKTTNYSIKRVKKKGNFVIYKTEDGIGCRGANQVEIEKFNQKDPNMVLRPITPPRPQGANGLTIILRGTAQLDNFPTAKAAFIKAAANWEALIANPITVVIDVDFGPQRFGQNYPPGVIGSTGSQELIFSNVYNDVRSSLVSGANTSQESSLYSSLPNGSIPTDIGPSNTMVIGSATARGLGLIDPVADPATETRELGDPPAIGFNSQFNFDFDPSNGIGSNMIDFDATATHEIGHALGFISSAGDRELIPSFPVAPTVWDLYRFRPGTTLSTFASANRVLSSGGDQMYFAGNRELALSTGRFNGSGGDGAQSSHWKARNFVGGTRIGIMDPFLSNGERVTIGANDIAALDTFGYSLKSQNDTVAPTVKVSAPNSNEVLLGGSKFTITWTTSDNGTVASHDIALSTDGGATFDTPIASGLAGSAQNFIWTVPTLDTNNARIRVTATDAAKNVGTDSSDANFSITKGSFALAFNQASQTFSAGNSATFNLNVQVLGTFDQNVTLASSVTPNNNVTATLSSTSVKAGGSATVTVSALPTTPSSSYTITITGTSGGTVRTATATVNVVASVISDFMLTATPATQTVTAGKATSFTVNTTAINGFTLPINLNATSSDPNIGVSFSSNPTLPGSTVTLTAVATPNATSSTVNLTITGTSGQLVHTATVALTVISQDFTLALDPLTIKRGQAGQFTVNIGRTGGFDGNVTVTAPDTKALKIKLTTAASQSTTGASVSFGFKAKKKAPLGQQQLVFTGTDSSGRVRTATLMLTIQ